MTRGTSFTFLALLPSCVVLAPRPADALFHIAHIAEVNARGGDDPTDQYVEIVMEAGSQTFTTNSVLGAWDCSGTHLGDLLVVPGDVPIGGAGRRWIMATKNPVGGITPDFVIPTAGIPGDCGQVCWGAPGITVPPLDSWDHTDPTKYVDCIPYGPYAGPTRAGSPPPTPLTPGDGTYALVRVDDTTAAAECPSPENNAGAVGGYGPCSDPTTTTTTTVTTVTTTSSTTTLPAGNADLLGGGIILSVKPGKPDKSRLKLTGLASISEALTLGRGPGSPDDPTLHGGRLLVFSSVAGAFVNDYPLDSATGSWAPKRKRGKQVGYVFKSDGPIKGVTIITDKKIVAKGRGAGLGHQLSVDPHPVGVILELGEHRYCWQSAQRIFKADKRFRSPKNPPPPACPTVPD
jgi:hypothetical protein